MRTRKLLLLSALAALLWAGTAVTLDTPHEGSFATSVTECQSCHKLHGSTGGSLLGNDYTSNNDACLTCHDSSTSPNHFFSPAWSNAGREAVPGVGGDQHRWSGYSTASGARLPDNAAMRKYLGNGLQCAACHDAHGAKDEWGSPASMSYAPNSPHASLKLGEAVGPVGGGTGRMMLITITDGGYAPVPAGYAIKIKAGNKLTISHDYSKLGAAATWLSFDIPYTVGTTSTNNVALDDPSVVVRFTAAPAENDIWQFYVSYPLLRASNAGDAMCLDCHIDRHQGYKCVQGDPTAVDALGALCTPDGTRKFSHPVGEALNSNTSASAPDRLVILDADGTEGESSADALSGGANPSNNLVLGTGGVVGCTTCHAPHNADSNSLTVEVR